MTIPNCDFHELIKETTDDHEHRLRTLETSNATTMEQMKQVCDRLGSLISWLKAISLLWVSGMLGFLFWAIQQGMVK